MNKQKYKIVFTGPVGAGKTTAITSISDTPPIETDVVASDGVKDRKEKTTVAMDYGVLNLEGAIQVHLYGTPGQSRFNFMWDILAKGSLGIILLIDNAEAEPLEQLRYFIDAYKSFITPYNLVVGVTRMDLQQRPLLADYHVALKKHNLNPPIFEVDARDKKDVSFLIQSLLYSLDPLT